MKKRWNGFLPGFLSALLLVSLFGGAVAASSYQKQATLDYTGIRITLDGKEVVPTDAAGTAVEPFSISGTTYLPVRGIANALGLDVDWDGATQTVKLASKTQPSIATGTLLMDKNGVKITFMGFAEKTNGLSGQEIKLKIENSAEKTYTVQARNVSVNGVMTTNAIFSTTVAPGKVANDGIWLYDLEEAGIMLPLSSAELYFQIYNDSDMMDTFKSDVIEIK